MKASYAVAQGYGEFIWKRTADRAKKDIEKHIEKTEKAEKVEKEEKE
jgi:nicotinamide riboside transporter PnuC